MYLYMDKICLDFATNFLKKWILIVCQKKFLAQINEFCPKTTCFAQLLKNSPKKQNLILLGAVKHGSFIPLVTTHLSFFLHLSLCLSLLPNIFISAFVSLPSTFLLFKSVFLYICLPVGV